MCEKRLMVSRSCSGFAGLVGANDRHIQRLKSSLELENKVNLVLSVSCSSILRVFATHRLGADFARRWWWPTAVTV